MFGPPSVFQIIGVNKAIPLHQIQGKTLVMVMGTYLKSKLLMLPKRELINMDNAFSRLIIENSVKYMTGGKCTNISQCLHEIHLTQQYIGKPNNVFHIGPRIKFDFEQLKKNISTNVWHFIIAGTFWAYVPSDELRNLATLFGIKITNFYAMEHLKLDENICKLERKI